MTSLLLLTSFLPGLVGGPAGSVPLAEQPATSNTHPGDHQRKLCDGRPIAANIRGCVGGFGYWTIGWRLYRRPSVDFWRLPMLCCTKLLLIVVEEKEISLQRGKRSNLLAADEEAGSPAPAWLTLDVGGALGPHLNEPWRIKMETIIFSTRLHSELRTVPSVISRQLSPLNNPRHPPAPAPRDFVVFTGPNRHPE